MPIEMSRTNLISQLNLIETKRRKMLKVFTNDSALIVGSITHTKGRCGKPNCACKKKPTHEITLLMIKENGKKRTQLVRKKDVKKIIALWEKYKSLKKMIGDLKIENQEEIKLIQQIIRCRKISYV